MTSNNLGISQSTVQLVDNLCRRVGQLESMLGEMQSYILRLGVKLDDVDQKVNGFCSEGMTMPTSVPGARRMGRPVEDSGRQTTKLKPRLEQHEMEAIFRVSRDRGDKCHWDPLTLTAPAPSASPATAIAIVEPQPADFDSGDGGTDQYVLSDGPSVKVENIDVEEPEPLEQTYPDQIAQQAHMRQRPPAQPMTTLVCEPAPGYPAQNKPYIPTAGTLIPSDKPSATGAARRSSKLTKHKKQRLRHQEQEGNKVVYFDNARGVRVSAIQREDGILRCTFPGCTTKTRFKHLCHLKYHHNHVHIPPEPDPEVLITQIVNR